MELHKIMNDIVCWSTTHIQVCGYIIIHCYAAIFLHGGFNRSGVTTRCAWPGRRQSVTELMPFINFSVYLYTCHSEKHASPYWTLIRRLISMGFTPPLRCSTSVHVASGAVVFTLLLRRCVAFLHCTATCRPLFKPSLSLLSAYKTIELCFQFLSHF
jgi:hypothetical protein